MRHWLHRTASVQRELAAIAEVDPRWWLLAGGVALAEMRATPEVYLATDAEPDGDTFMGYRSPRPHDVVHDAIERARAARAALREIDGTLLDQRLAVTIDHSRGAGTHPSDLTAAAFAIGRVCLVADLEDETLPAQLAAVLRGQPPPRWLGATPFVCVSIGEEPIETARHGHRRAWTDAGGPWLGLGRTRELATVSTCHLIIDGYGHALLTARIAELTKPSPSAHTPAVVPALAPVRGGVPLHVTWSELTQPTPRVLPLAYDLGCLLHRELRGRNAPFSPTIQIPVARGSKDDPLRLRRRVVSATTSVRFDRGVPEPFEQFESRTREVIAREAAGEGLVSRLLAAARAVPVPLAWKRRSIGAKRARWLESFAEIIGGRVLVSRIAVDALTPPLCAVSSPSRLATEADPVGGCVVTIVDDGRHAAITVCGSGVAGELISSRIYSDLQPIGWTSVP